MRPQDIIPRKIAQVALASLTVTLVACSAGEPERDNGAESESYRKRAAMSLFVDGLIYEAKNDHERAVAAIEKALENDNEAGMYYALAKNYYYLGKLRAALERAKLAAAMDPEEISHLLLLAEIYEAGGRDDSAIVSLKRALRLDSTRHDAKFRLASLHEDEKPTVALELYESLNDSLGADWNLLLRQANLQERLGRDSAAIETLETLLEMDPNNVAVRKLIVEFHLRNDDAASALAVVEDLTRDFPNDVEAAERKIDILMHLNDWGGAVEETRRLLSLPNATFDVKLRAADYLYENATGDSSRLAAASATFRTLETDTTSWETKMYRGSAALALGELDSAEARFREAVELAPWRQDGWTRLGNLYFEHGEFDSAASATSRAVERFPESFVLNAILGLSYLRLGETLAAIPPLEKATELDPSSADLFGSLASAYENAGEYAKSDSAYDRALAADPTNAIVNNNYAYSLARRGERLDDALAMANVALEANPSSASFLDTKAWVLYQMERYEEAEALLALAAEQDPLSAVVFDHWGDALYRLGEREEALAKWERALELDPENIPVRDKLNRGTL
jgi:tetratricopeptide (TPR) repeat protein